MATGSLLRRLASLLFNRAIQTLLRLPFRDTQCGLKGFRRQAALQLFGLARLDGFAFDAELLFLAHWVGLPVVEVPVRAEERDGSKVRLTVDALRMLRDVLIVRRGAAKGVYELARPEQGKNKSSQGRSQEPMVGAGHPLRVRHPGLEAVGKPDSIPAGDPR